jgi:DNA polymerase V
MTRGGKRPGAGRPRGKGKFSQATKPIRVPVDMVDTILNYASNGGFSLPLYASRVAAGFPSPADDYEERRLDLNEHLVRNPEATFFVRASGDSMINAGIHPGDILVVDRGLEAKHGKVIIAIIDNELTVKRLYKKNDVIKLVSENSNYNPIELNEENQLQVWGVVTNVIHSL